MLCIRYLFVALCLFILMCGSCVCANDVNETVDMNTEMSNMNVTSLDMSHQPVNTPGSFDELKSNIESLNSGDVFNMNKDYCLDNVSNIGIKSCITVKADNITINGNGHSVNGNNHSVSFKITGNDVKIFDLKFSNCQGYSKSLKVNIDGSANSFNYMDNKSPVYWVGNNGIISDCIFSKNGGVNGGAVNWMGNNGTINRVTFENNKAKGAGGAIYLSGKNNNITNCVFINSSSQLFNESVFLDNKHESCNISKNNYCNSLFLIDASQFNICADNLCKVYYSQFAQKEFNIVPIIYSSLFGINHLDNETVYYGQFFNETHTYKLSLIKIFKKYNITYEMDYIISVDDLKNVFSSLMSNFYKINLKYIKTVNVNTTDEYNKVCNRDVNYYILNTSFMDYVRNDTNISNLGSIDYVLNVNYGNNSYFSSNAQWMENSGFNITIINGNNATIHATSSSSDENKWIINHDNTRTFFISNLTVEGFNTAVENLNGSCIFNNVLFKNNKKDYFFQRDDGGAIINAGLVICNNCTFINNYAKNGGAVFNQGMLILENPKFKDNKAYHRGEDVLNVDQGIVILNNKTISGSEGNIAYVKSISNVISTIVSGVAIICTVAIGVLATVASGGLLMGMAAGVGAGVILGGLAAGIITSNQYNLQFNRITTTLAVIGTCVAAGLIAPAITHACKGVSYNFEIDSSKSTISNDEIITKDTNNIKSTISNDEIITKDTNNIIGQSGKELPQKMQNCKEVFPDESEIVLFNEKGITDDEINNALKDLDLQFSVDRFVYNQNGKLVIQHTNVPFKSSSIGVDSGKFVSMVIQPSKIHNGYVVSLIHYDGWSYRILSPHTSPLIIGPNPNQIPVV